ncbi:hypothetical protein D3C87_1701100 [compost metagenome]
MQKFYAESIFERCHVLGGHGWRHAERSCSSGQAADCSDPGENLHSGDAIQHDYLTLKV